MDMRYGICGLMLAGLLCGAAARAATVQVIPRMYDVSAFSYPQPSGTCGETYDTRLLVGNAWLPASVGQWRQRDAADPYSWEREITWHQYTWAIPAAQKRGVSALAETGDTAIYILQTPVDPSPRTTTETPFLTYNSLVDGTSRIDFFEQQRNGRRLDNALEMNSSAEKPGRPAYNGSPQLAGNLAAMINELNRSTPLQYQSPNIWPHQRDLPVYCGQPEELSTTGGDAQQNGQSLADLAKLAGDRLGNRQEGDDSLEALAALAGERLGTRNDNEDIDWAELAEQAESQMDDWDEAERRAAARLAEEQRQQALARQNQQAAERARQLALEQARREQYAYEQEQYAYDEYEGDVAEGPGFLGTLATGLLQGYLQYQANRSGAYVPPIYGVNTGPVAGNGGLSTGSNGAGCAQIATQMEQAYARVDRSSMCSISQGLATAYEALARQAQTLCPAAVTDLVTASRENREAIASLQCGAAAPPQVNTWNPATAAPAPPAAPNRNGQPDYTAPNELRCSGGGTCTTPAP